MDSIKGIFGTSDQKKGVAALKKTRRLKKPKAAVVLPTKNDKSKAAEIPLDSIVKTVKRVEKKRRILSSIAAASKVESKPNTKQISQKKKQARTERRYADRVAKNGKNDTKNYPQNSAFALPEETLSIENYYKLCNLTCENGIYLDPKSEKNDVLMGCLIFDNKEVVSDDITPVQSNKVLPKIYENLLNDIRANKKNFTEKLLKRSPYDVEILPKLRKKIISVQDAGKKFEVFNYFQLVDEFVSFFL
uniref:Uncharacterized protein n=1 Tax=Panagrolaimus superbus TaxID=310955 RepID=A0A914Y7T9_9BILA